MKEGSADPLTGRHVGAFSPSTFTTVASYDFAYLEMNALGQTFAERNFRHIMYWDGEELAVSEARPVLPVDLIRIVR